jgi:hypothetical protein
MRLFKRQIERELRAGAEVAIRRRSHFGRNGYPPPCGVWWGRRRCSGQGEIPARNK